MRLRQLIPIPWGGVVPPFLCHVTVKSQVERTRVTSHRPLGPCLNSLHVLFSLGFEANHSRCRRFGKNIAFSVAELARFRDSAGHKKRQWPTLRRHLFSQQAIKTACILIREETTDDYKSHRCYLVWNPRDIPLGVIRGPGLGMVTLGVGERRRSRPLNGTPVVVPYKLSFVSEIRFPTGPAPATPFAGKSYSALTDGHWPLKVPD